MPVPPCIRSFFLACFASAVLAAVFFGWLCLDRTAARAAAAAEAAAQMPSAQPIVPTERSQPFLVAPVIDGALICEAAGQASEDVVENLMEAKPFCRARGETAAPLLARLLDSLEPGGPAGEVHLGYTLGIPLLALWQPSDAGWAIDESEVDAYLSIIAEVERPVVLYFLANHFESYGDIAEELRQNPDNLMQLAAGRELKPDYFGYTISPWTLSGDATIPVNHYRLTALDYVVQKVLALPAAVRARIVAYTLAGELHHLFPDFTHGMGAYQEIAVTDYSPRAVAGFRHWLQAQYGTVAQLNAEMGQDWPDFAAIAPPAKDIRRERLNTFADHYDAWADGTLPLSGWLWDPQQVVQQLDLYLNGKYHARVPRGFNRLDVYRALDEVTDPNTGFRYDLDFSQLPPGSYIAQIVAQTRGKQAYEVARRELAVMARNQTLPRQRSARPRALPDIGQLQPRGVRAWLDLPAAQRQDLYYNPLARAWNAWRQQQVYGLLGAFYTRALRAGLPAEKLYSHQILAEVNSTWNPQLLASSSTIASSTPWKPGVNLYGGAAHNAWLRAWLHERGIHGGYGVPEFNPQQWKSPGIHLAALQAHYEAGADFVAPYYFSLIHQRFYKYMVEHGVNRMELAPDNPKDGSDQFYQAIREFVAR